MMNRVSRIWVVAAAVAAIPAPARAESPGERDGSRGLDVTVDLATLAADGGTLRLALPLLPSTIVHRFLGEIVDSTGAAVAAAVAWEATLLDGHGLALVRLHPGANLVSLPRALGVLIAADSLRIQLRLDDGAPAGGLQLQVGILYDFVESGLRFPALIAQAQLLEASSGSERSWEFDAPASGRVVALLGLSFDGAGELVLHEAATGAVVWRESVRHGGPGFVQTGGTVIVSARVRQGVRYRLTARGALRQATLLPLVLPVTAVAAAAGDGG